MTALMRAWRSPEETGLAALEIVQIPVPAPGDNEILVKVDAAALNFSDLLMIDGIYQIRPDRPFTPGQEIAGFVISAGSASGFAAGARVAGKVLWGGFAEYAILRADMAIALPDGIGAPEGATLPIVYTTAMVALVEDANIKPGDTVLIHAAAGGVGLAAVQIAKACGARVIAAATGPEKRVLVAANGADVAIDYKAEDFVEVVASATGGKGVDIILDSVGGEITAKSLRCIAWQGQLLIVGFSSGEIPKISANRLLLRRAVARGIYWDHDRDADMVARCTEKLIGLCLDGGIKPVISGGYGFDDLPRALEDLRAGSTVGKVILSLGEETST